MELQTLVKLMDFKKFKINKEVTDEFFDEYENVNNYLKNYGYNFKKFELKILKKFLELLDTEDSSNKLYHLTEGFLLNYQIPNIGKEFDLLRLGKNYNLCIEIKLKADINKQKSQLIKDKFYLDLLGETIYISYESETNRIIKLESKNEYKVISGADVVNILRNQEVKTSSKEELDKLLSFNNYIISPFNNTDRFLAEQYFLTNHQKEIFESVVKNEFKFYLIEGGAGTGKSLLIYHLVKELKKKNKNCLVIHCGLLNEGHYLLNDKGFDIIAAKYCEENLESVKKQYDYIFIDEGQRFYERQFNNVLEQKASTIVYSMDPKQIFNSYENIEEKVKKHVDLQLEKGNAEKFELNQAFRYENNIFPFIELIFRHSIEDNIKIDNRNKNIELHYFDSKEEAREYLSNLSTEQWKITDYSRSKYDEELPEIPRFKNATSHTIIGQEFENVVVMLDRNFSYIYNENNEHILHVSDTYYSLKKMLYQNLTRAKLRLKIIIIGNSKLFCEIANLLTEF